MIGKNTKKVSNGWKNAKWDDDMRFRWLIILLSVAATLSYVVPAHLCPLNYPADDAYFYLQVASQAYEGYGSTFNQITPTNGYHPLWMLCCTGLFYLMRGDKILALHAAIGLQQAMGLATVLIFLHLGKRLSIRRAFLALPVLFLFYSTRLYASEAYVNGFFLLLMLWAGVAVAERVLAGERVPLLRVLGVGVLGGLAMLARLDNVFVTGCFMLCTAGLLCGGCPFQLFSRGVAARIVLLGGGCLVVFVPYLLFNRAVFGHWMPVSGAIKSTLPNLVFNPDGLSGIGKVCALTGVGGLAGALFLRMAPIRRYLLTVLSGGVVLHAAQIVFTTSHHTQWPWYYVAGVINLCFCGVMLADWIADIRGFRSILSVRFLLPLTLMLVTVVNGYAALRYRSSAPTIRESFELERLEEGIDLRWQQRVAVWLSETLPPESGVAVYDWPGMFAYTSDLRILPIDGLINDYRYNDEVLAEGIDAFLKHRRVTYWLGPCDPLEFERQAWYSVREIPGGVEIEVMAPLYRKSAGAFQVRDADRVARLREVIHHPDLPNLALWRIR
ncbi:MAG: hypothetical protein PHP44_04085 [Kiritimatiellae bacterium]|nr:hypothetical protein [Kiritimatiellia bacterium]